MRAVTAGTKRAAFLCAGASGAPRRSNLGKPAQRRNSPPVNGAKGTGTICANCQTTQTPLWRKDRPSGARPRSCCPAHPFLPAWRRLSAMHAGISSVHAGGPSKPSVLGHSCLWIACSRHGPSREQHCPLLQLQGGSAYNMAYARAGLIMCNACGIYLKTHGRNRPVDGASGALARASSLKRVCGRCFTRNTLTSPACMFVSSCCHVRLVVLLAEPGVCPAAWATATARVLLGLQC